MAGTRKTTRPMTAARPTTPCQRGQCLHPGLGPAADDRPGHSELHAGQRGDRESARSTTDVSMINLAKAIAQNYVQNYRQLMRGVFTLTGALNLFGEDWIVERLCPEQLGARAAMGPLQHLEHQSSTMPSIRWWSRRPARIRWAAAIRPGDPGQRHPQGCRRAHPGGGQHRLPLHPDGDLFMAPPPIRPASRCFSRAAWRRAACR